MKVLSLTEPCATLIKEKKKLVETRSWKTSYRGELYIHASNTKIPKEWKENTEFMGLVKDKTLNFGDIICKCNLVDCIYMTKEYVENMKKIIIKNIFVENTKREDMLGYWKILNH